MTHAVEEIWVGERNMLRAHVNELSDIRQHDVLGYSPKPAAVDRGDRAVQAAMRAAAAGFDGAGKPVFPAVIEPRRAIERRQARSIRAEKLLTAERGLRRDDLLAV